MSLVTDLRYRKIFHVVTLPAMGLGLLGHALLGWNPAPALGLRASLIGLAVGFVPFFLAALPRWMGMGDAMLMGAAGALLGFPFVLGAMLLTFVAGGVQALAQLGWSVVRGTERPRRLPYGLAIALGCGAELLLRLRS